MLCDYSSFVLYCLISALYLISTEVWAKTNNEDLDYSHNGCTNKNFYWHICVCVGW